MKPDPSLTEQEQIALYDAEIRNNLWQAAALVVLILAALLKGYTLHIEESLGEAENQMVFAQDLLISCQANAQQTAGSLKSVVGCEDREADLKKASDRVVEIKSNGFNAFALSVFGTGGQSN